MVYNLCLALREKSLSVLGVATADEVVEECQDGKSADRGSFIGGR